MRRESSIDGAYFEQLYRDHGDPWHFETSPYEAAKYRETLRTLPSARYADALEVGCANGVLTAQLGSRCDRLLAVDIAETALLAAQQRCANQPHIRFERRALPAEWPDGCFDLILLSEVVYYWDSGDIARSAERICATTRSGSVVQLVHWIGETDYPKSGDAAVAELAEALGGGFEPLRADRHECYRLDLWQRR